MPVAGSRARVARLRACCASVARALPVQRGERGEAAAIDAAEIPGLAHFDVSIANFHLQMTTGSNTMSSLQAVLLARMMLVGCSARGSGLRDALPDRLGTCAFVAYEMLAGRPGRPKPVSERPIPIAWLRRGRGRRRRCIG